MSTVRSLGWGYARIIVGTLVGGGLGFYAMHRLETSYKAKWDERLKKYQEEMLRREGTETQADDSLCFADSPQAD